MDVVLFFLEPLSSCMHYPWLLVKENQQHIIKSLVNYFVYSGIFFKKRNPLLVALAGLKLTIQTYLALNSILPPSA